jgi:hypothetical protein
MSYQKYLSYLSALSVALCVELVTFSSVMPLSAEPLKVSLTFPPVDNVGAPARTAGGGQRGGPACVRGKIPLTALAPSNNLGTTVSGNPTLFWYVPQTEAKSAKFVMLDNQANAIYTTILPLKGTPGVVKLSLPANVSLQPGQDYTTELTLNCDSENPSDQRIVQGLVKRTELNAQQKTQLAAATEPLQKAQVYAQAKVWQETLTILAQLRSTRPNDPRITDAWQELLKSVQLEPIATEPLLECCTSDNLPTPP